MKKVFSSDLRKNLKEYLDMAAQEPLLIERRTAEGLVILSEEMYNKLVEKEPSDIQAMIEKSVDAQLEKRLAAYADMFSKMK